MVKPPDKPPRKRGIQPGMQYRRTKLETWMEFHQSEYKELLYIIERGAYDYVAAQVMGIGSRTLYRWLERGHDDYYAAEDDEPLSIYAVFYRDFFIARAKARMSAEQEVHMGDPKFWLRCGPGKSRPGEEGWTETHDIRITQRQRTEDTVKEDDATPDEQAEALNILTHMLQRGAIKIGEHEGNGNGNGNGHPK